MFDSIRDSRLTDCGIDGHGWPDIIIVDTLLLLQALPAARQVSSLSCRAVTAVLTSASLHRRQPLSCLSLLS